MMIMSAQIVVVKFSGHKARVVKIEQLNITLDVLIVGKS
jgi:hypothetical protein